MSTKRPAEDSVPVLRRTRIKLASPSPERTSESDTESIHSCQGYKTDLANDTSDTSSIQQSISTEYEITDSYDNYLKFYYSDDSLELESLQGETLNISSSDSLDIALLGDTSEENSTSPSSNSDVDPGLPRSDYLDFEKCLLCETDKKNISYPYCSSCFAWKKNMFPKRPKKRKRGIKDSFNKNISELQNYKASDVENKHKENSLSDNLFEDSGMGSAENQLSEDTVDGPSQPSTSSSTSAGSSPNSRSFKDVCRVCFLKPENGLFVHLNSAHQYGCYSCAKEIWYRSGSCPLCRRKVFKVTILHT